MNSGLVNAPIQSIIDWSKYDAMMKKLFIEGKGIMAGPLSFGTGSHHMQGGITRTCSTGTGLLLCISPDSSKSCTMTGVGCNRWLCPHKNR
eukprot:15337020-Ditylum_brightwellii.AAC.1